MSPVSRSTAAGRAYLDIQRLARSTKRPTDELLRTYVLERFLWRVANSVYWDQLVLKGGMLLAVHAPRRPTADVDLLALDLSNDSDGVSAMIGSIVAVGCDDGVSYAVDRISVTTIRDDDIYPGVWVVVPAAIARAQSVLRVDVSVGDPVTPAPVTLMYPALLHEPFAIAGYPIETVLAEKIVTMIDRGSLTTRERDFADVYLLTARLTVDADLMARAIAATMAHRGSRRRPLSEALGVLGEQRQGSWRAFVSNAGLIDSVPASYRDAIDAATAFAQPLLDDEVTGRTWDPITRRWI